MKKLTLGVAEPKLGAAITEALAISCNHIGPIPEILRGLFVSSYHVLEILCG